MEAIAADLVLGIGVIGQGVNKGFLGHGLAPGGIEHRHHGHAGHDLHAAPDAHQVGGVVEGAQGYALFDGGQHVVVDDHGLGELLAAMEHPMAHRVDLVHALHHADILVRQGFQHHADGLGMILHVLFKHVGILARGLVGQLRAVDADALAKPLGDNRAAVHVDELILQGRAACVDDQYLHNIPPKFMP